MGLRFACIDTVNTITLVVLFLVSLFMIFGFSYKTLDHQCLKKQVKSPSIVLRPLHPPRRGWGCDSVKITGNLTLLPEKTIILYLSLTKCWTS